MAKSSKGPNFERDICKQLSLWWTDNQDDAVFWRTAGSGARATARSKCGKKTENSYGDICYTKAEGKALVDFLLMELKRGYTNEINVLDFIDKIDGRKPSILFQWWDKAEKEREESGRKYTVIVFRRDSHRACIMMQSDLYTVLYNHCGVRFTNIIRTDNLVIMRLEDFLNWVDRATIELLLENR